MTIQERDNHSGAIIFRPTPEEQEVAQLKNELQGMKEEMSEKLALIDEILEKNKEV